MAGFNKILLLGNLTRDPQLSYTPSQIAVVDFGIATNRKWTAQDGQQREEVCFVDCRAFNKTAETLSKYLSRGMPVFIEGRLSFDRWTTQDGTKRSKHRVIIEKFQFLPGGNNQSRNTQEDELFGPDNQSNGQDDYISPNDEIPF